MSKSRQKLTEGLDYYIEADCWVFTAAYHRKRGHCCKSVCRHCPFGNSPADLKNAENAAAARHDGTPS